MGNTIYIAYRTQTFTPETKISKISTSFTVRNTYWFFLSVSSLFHFKCLSQPTNWLYHLQWEKPDAKIVWFRVVTDNYWAANVCEALNWGCHMHCLLSAPLGSSKRVLIPFPLYGWGAGAQGEVKWLAQGHKASENSWATISSSVLNTNDLVSQLSFWSMVHFILQLEGRRSGRLGALLKDAQLGSFRAASDCGFGTPSPGLSLPWLAAHSAQLETSLWNLSKQMRATQCPLPPSYSDETK